MAGKTLLEEQGSRERGCLRIYSERRSCALRVKILGARRRSVGGGFGGVAIVLTYAYLNET